MTTLRTTFLAVSMTLAASSFAGPPEPKKTAETEKIAALGLKGDPVRGKEAYKVCAACHLDTGAGRADGTFPQLAGQHTTVIIKQVADIRAGVRDNPVMHPFSTTLTDPQELADVAAYIDSLKVPADNQKGSGTELALGKKVYEKDCVTCHGKNGEGDAAKFIPELAGQHFAYMLKQSQEIRDGKRKNANADMAKVIKKLGDNELTAIADYLSRLATPAKAPPTPAPAPKK
jgi:cytochrome c553